MIRTLVSPGSEVMLDLLTIFSAAGLQQELKAAHGDKSLVIREDSELEKPRKKP